MRKFRNLILTFLLMFVGVVGASALTNEEMENIEQKYRKLRSTSVYFENDKKQFYYFEEGINPNINFIGNYATWVFDYNQYILNPNVDYGATGEYIKYQVPKDVFEANIEKTFVVNDDFYTELHNNFRPSMSNENSGYKEIEGSYYYYYELHYGIGGVPSANPHIKGYKDLGNNQYQVYFYNAIEKEYAEYEEGVDLMNEDNVYITRKYADEDTEYLVLGYLTSKIEYKNNNIKYLSHKEIKSQNIPSDLVLYENIEEEKTSDKEETIDKEENTDKDNSTEKDESSNNKEDENTSEEEKPSDKEETTDKEESKEEINVSDKTWKNFLTELSKKMENTEIEYTDNSLTVEYYRVYGNSEIGSVETILAKFSYEDGILKLNVGESSENLDYVVYTILEIFMSDLKYGEKRSLTVDMLKYGLNNTFTLKNDGIEYAIKEGATETYISFEKFLANLKNGLNAENLKKFHKGINAYKYLDGEEQKFNTNENKKLTFRIEADFKLFDGLYIDGEEVDKKYYTATEGSTIITFNEEYTKKMSEGQHTMKATFTDGKQAITEFTVEKTVKNPSTGISIKLGVFVLIVSILGICYLLIGKQSRFPKHN